MKTDIIKRFNSGNATEDEVRQIEEWIESDNVELHELDGYAELLAWYRSVHDPEPGESMSETFYEALAREKIRHSSGWSRLSILDWSPAARWAYSLVLLLGGLAGGWFLGQTNEKPTGNEITRLTREVSEMKEMMMLNMLQEESTSRRLQAVNLTSDLPEVTSEVTTALFRTLNNDRNVNVRLATLEALYPYANNPQVREGLIQSIALQDSPLVQVALAEMMVALQEKNSIQQLEKLLENRETPEDVKREIEKSLSHLI